MAKKDDKKALLNEQELEIRQDTVEQKDESSAKELSIGERKVRHGIFSTASVIVVIALVVALNVFLSSKDWKYDFTAEKLYTLSDATEKLVNSLEKDQKINIYFLNAQSEVNTVYKNILSQYEKLSKMITVEYKDLELYPNFAADYLSEGQSAAENDMIVVCGDRYRYISSSDYLTQDYNTGGTTVNVETRVTSAIDYCVSEEISKVYVMSGQGEQALSSNFETGLTNDNYEVEELDIVSTGGIPTDCNLLIINAPTADLSEGIIQNIEQYMENDGKLFVVLDPTKMYKNLNGLLAKYGVKVEEGIVIDPSAGYYMSNYPTYLLPTVASHEISTPISNANLHIVAPVSKGLSTISDVEGYTVTDLLVTSAESYSKIDTESSDVAKKDEDVAGPLAIAQIVTNSDDKGVLFVSGSSSMGQNDIDDYVANANSNFYCNAVNYMAEAQSKISVKAPTVTQNYAVFSAFASKMIMAIGIIGIPLLLIVLGIVVMVVRRNN